MSLRLTVLPIVLAAAVGPATAASHPRPGSPDAAAILYRDIGFRGPSFSLDQPQPELSLPWPVQSIRVGRGAWELCARPRYEGLCTRYTSSERVIPAARQRVRSARPVTDPAPE